MIVDLNERFILDEVATIKVYGRIEQTSKIEFTFSKEALVGFATNLIWIYEDIDEKKHIHFHVDPLGNEIVANQALGFFLTPTSPSMVMQINGVHQDSVVMRESITCKQLEFRYKRCSKLEIREPSEAMMIEEYELGMRNIVNIKIIDEKDNDISKQCIQIVVGLNYKTIKRFASMLLVLADNFSVNCEYLLANEKRSPNQYNLGILLDRTSPEVVIKCGDVGCVYDYDTTWGIF